MHSKVISKIRCYSPNSKNTPVRNYNYLVYIATREGVDLEPFQEESIADNETYIHYIHERPRSHGLFGNLETDDLSSICKTMRKVSKKQCVYRGILSLSEEDALDLDFMTKDAWKDYLTSSLPDIAEVFGIPSSELEWVAAFHKEKGHPHVHYMLWSKNSKCVQSPFISVPQQHKCRELFSGRFFAAERAELNILKTKQRNKVIASGKQDTQTDLQRLVEDICSQDEYKVLNKINRTLLNESSRKLLDLVEHLPPKGSIKYAYMPPEVKNKVDEFVQAIIHKQEIKQEYDAFLNYHKQIAETYSPTKRELQVAILKAKEDIDQRLANVVLKAAQELRKEKDIYYAIQNTHLPGYQSLLKNGISQETISALLSEAQTGNDQAAYLLGRIYDDPESDFYDPDAAIQYYHQSADDGNPYAKGILGSKYLWGKDVEQDIKYGRRILHEAEDAGYQYAKDTEDAFDSYQQERAQYYAVSLISRVFKSVCHSNNTRRPSSVYRPSYDADNVKLRREMAKKHPHKS